MNTTQAAFGKMSLHSVNALLVIINVDFLHRVEKGCQITNQRVDFHQIHNPAYPLQEVLAERNVLSQNF